LICLLNLPATAQSPRLSLYEYFSGENCAPCASVNPYVNGLLAQASYTSKVVGITWPGPLPSAPSATTSLYNNFKSGIDWRFGAAGSGGYGYSTQWTASATAVSGITTTPMGLFDGRHQWQFGAANDWPGNINNSVITAAQSPTTAFTMGISGNWNNTFSALELTVNVMATAGYTASGPLVLRLVMLEKEIYLNEPSGTTGETTFKNIAVAAFPDLQNGTPIATSWTVNQSQTYTLNCPLPAYIHNKAQVSIVGFIQDDGNRQVQQAARYTPPLPDNDMVARWLLVPPIGCGNTFTPAVVVANAGGTPVYSFAITPYLNSASLAPVAWNGTLNPGATLTLTLASYTASLAGGNAFSYSIANVSGNDYNALNNATTAVVFMALDYPATTVTENFGSNTFPPPGWGISNGNFGAGWSLTNQPNGPSLTGGTGAACCNFFGNSQVGDVDELLLPPLTLTSGIAPVLNFDVAYAMYSVDNDRLDVQASNNCGKTWVTLYSKSGAGLATAPAQTTVFIPSPSQWRSETVALSGFNTGSVLVKFVATSAFGNNLYVDNVRLTETNPLAIQGQQISNGLLRTYPNPADTKLIAECSFAQKEPLAFAFYHVSGQLVLAGHSQVQPGGTALEFNTSTLPDGIYLLKLSQQGGVLMAKVIIRH